MKHAVKGFKNLKLGLKELEPFIRDGRHLQTGRKFRSMGLLSREVLANWLICATINSTTTPDRFTFTSSPEEVGGDGVIVDRLTEETWVTEHIIVANVPKEDGLDTAGRILAAIEKKRGKGDAPYAVGKTLVVFVNREGREWYPTKVARALPDPLLFDTIWVVSLESVVDGSYLYNVTTLDLSGGQAPAWRVHIAAAFDAWTVSPVQ